MRLVLVISTLCLTGCGHFHASKSAKKSHPETLPMSDYFMQGEIRRAERDFIIAKRVSAFERQGLSPAEARAAAQAEYTATGGPVPSDGRLRR